MSLAAVFSSLSFASPWVLAGLIGLPLIWWIARATPPAPKSLVFPPAALLEDLPKTDEATRTAPWWLKLLRMAAIALVLLGLSGPRIDPQTRLASGDLVIVIDNGWSSAEGWNARIREAARAASAAEGTVRLVFTAPDRTGPDPRTGMSPAQAAAILQAVNPVPLPVDHAGAARALAGVGASQSVLWFSDGLQWPGTDSLKAALARTGDARVRLPDVTSTAITSVRLERGGTRVAIASGPDSLSRPTVEARDSRGRILATATAETGRGSILIPLGEGQARALAEVRVRGAAGAGAVRLLDAWDRRARIGIVAARADDQPLLSDAHYLAAAVEPWADTSRGEAATLVRAGFNAILLPDTGLLESRDERALSRFVDGGGVLIRFAGPRFAETGGRQLSPVTVSTTPRILTGALAWQQAGSLAPFRTGSPFAGLQIPPDARIRRIAVTERENAGAAVWATLADGTALVSARRQGQGWLVLFHSTAGPGWSDVAFSGVQIGMLRRAVAQATTAALPASQVAPSVPLKPVLLVDGAGRLRPPGPEDRSVLPDEVATARPDLWRWPGVYQGGGARLVVQPVPEGLRLDPLGRLPSGLTRLSAALDGPVDLRGPILAVGVVMLLAELVATLALAGMLAGKGGWRGFTLPALRPGRMAGLHMALVLLAAMSVLVPALASRAQDAFELPDGFELPPGLVLPGDVRSGQPVRRGASQTAENAGPETVLENPQLVHLAWLRTGNAENDTRARQGLQGLALTLAERTSVVPGEVVGLSPTDPELALVPVLYWRLAPGAGPLAPEAVTALNRYMANGGLLFIDTGAFNGDGDARALAGGPLRGLSLPPLQQVPPRHVLTRTFYLLANFPGRYADAVLWTESAASAATNANDGVSPVLIGNGDWASAWARTAAGAPLASIEGSERQRELADRVGINAVLYALTGNYKSDQVHIPALLERIGADSLPETMAAPGRDGTPDVGPADGANPDGTAPDGDGP